MNSKQNRTKQIFTSSQVPFVAQNRGVSTKFIAASEVLLRPHPSLRVANINLVDAPLFCSEQIDNLYLSSNPMQKKNKKNVEKLR